MARILRFTVFSFFLLTAMIVSGQTKEAVSPQKGTTVETDNTKKAANHNTTRSNRSTVAPETESGSTGTQATTGSKKGYDYYKARSQGGDYNSSRSNTTTSKPKPDLDKNGSPDLKKDKVDEKVNKDEHARAKKKNTP